MPGLFIHLSGQIYDPLQRAYVGGIAAALLVGVFKEIIDPVFDWKEVEYDALGAVTVPLLVISW